MTLSVKALQELPAVFEQLAGLSVAQFDQFIADLLLIVSDPEYRRQPPLMRQPAQSGRPYRLTLVDEILLTLVWFRHRPIQQAMGDLFGVSDTTAMRIVKRRQPLLESAALGSKGLPDPGRGRRKSLARLLKDVPGLKRLLPFSTAEYARKTRRFPWRGSTSDHPTRERRVVAGRPTVAAAC